jgi:hypothetical protein
LDSTFSLVLSVSDAEGNVDTCTSQVTVRDTLPPEFRNCQKDTVNWLGETECEVSVKYGYPYLGDNCYFITKDSFCCIWSGEKFPLGETRIVFEATDQSNNTGTCTFTVTVQDSIKPTAKCRDFPVFVQEFSDAILIADSLDNGSTDNCEKQVLSFSIQDSTFDCSHLGTQRITLSVTAGGLTDTCTSRVYVFDTLSPHLRCQDATISLGSDGMASIAPSQLVVSAENSCGGSVAIRDTLFGYPIGTVSGEALYGDTLELEAPPGMVFDSILFAGYGHISGFRGSYAVIDTCQDTTALATVRERVVGQNRVRIKVDYLTFSPTLCGLQDELLAVSARYIPISPNRDSLRFDCTQLGANTVVLSITDTSYNSALCTPTVTVLAAPADDPCADVATSSLDSLALIPNPTRNAFRLIPKGLIPSPLTVTILDGRGRRVQERRLSQMWAPVSFDVSTFAGGLYLVVVEDSGKKKTFRLVIE